MATIYVKINRDENIRVGRLFTRTILATNASSRYTRQGIPLETQLKVSDRDFKGAKAIPRNISNIAGVRYAELWFCPEEFDKYFPGRPENLYWKAL